MWLSLVKYKKNFLTGNVQIPRLAPAAVNRFAPSPKDPVTSFAMHFYD